MQKNLIGRLTLTDKKYIISISAGTDGNIYLSGKVDEPEEKLKIIKMAWETKGARSVQSTITIKEIVILKVLQRIFLNLPIKNCTNI